MNKTKYEKQLTVLNSCNGEISDLLISPGASMKEFLSIMKLGSGFQILRVDYTEIIEKSVDMYSEIQDGEKIIVVTSAFVSGENILPKRVAVQIAESDRNREAYIWRA